MTPIDIEPPEDHERGGLRLHDDECAQLARLIATAAQTTPLLTEEAEQQRRAAK